MTTLNYPTPSTLAIALGANISSPAGPPVKTLVTIKPLLEKSVCEWIQSLFKATKDIDSIHSNLHWKWSPLYETSPVGGPENQPDYVNAVVVIRGGELNQLKPSKNAAFTLLKMLLEIEKRFGRDRETSKTRWGPRPLDLDILAWGDLQIKNELLTLPHPQMIERDFVVIPLGDAIKKNTSGIIELPSQPGW